MQGCKKILPRWGCQISWGSAHFPRKNWVCMGVPDFLGCKIYPAVIPVPGPCLLKSLHYLRMRNVVPPYTIQ